MTSPATLDPAARRRGFLLGAPVGVALAHRRTDAAPPPGRRDAAVALGDGLLEELLSGGVDLRRLSRRWVAWWESDGLGADPALVEALTWLRDTDAPPSRLASRGPAAIVAALPAALASASPRTMTSGAFHTARLLDPDPDACLAAVAVVVAAARLLDGSRDVIPEVLTLLRTNRAGEALLDRFVAIVRDPRDAPAIPDGPGVAAVDAAVTVLWTVHHQPDPRVALGRLTATHMPNAAVLAATAALLGARDGTGQWPEAWLAAAGEEVTLREAVARRLDSNP